MRPNDLSRVPAMLVDSLHCNPSLFVAAASEAEEEEEEESGLDFFCFFNFVIYLSPVGHHQP
jgi:hypothetical protein